MPLPLITNNNLENPNNVGNLNLSPDQIACIKVLNGTLEKFETLGGEQVAVSQAKQNHQRWAADPKIESSAPPRVRVVDQDWGVTTLERTKATGATYAVLNMANAVLPGGHYRTGGFAQEENIFWRTNCHYHIMDTDVVNPQDFQTTYTPKMTDLINGAESEVYLDRQNPRVCIRGPGGRDGTPYKFLEKEDYFLFHELRSAAQYLTYPEQFSQEIMRQKIHAQLQTLQKAEVKHVILSAFGCGMFRNPPTKVAQIYREELSKHTWNFKDITFAIAGNDKRNFLAFQYELHELGLTPEVREQDTRNWLTALKNNLELPKWQTKGASILFFPPKTPQGIQNILRILNDPNMQDSAKLQAIQTIAQKRLAHKPLFTKRDTEVTALYTAIQGVNLQNASASIAAISAPQQEDQPNRQNSSGQSPL